jgi:hypothetical protein
MEGFEKVSGRRRPTSPGSARACVSHFCAGLTGKHDTLLGQVLTQMRQHLKFSLPTPDSISLHSWTRATLRLASARRR